MFRFQTRPAHYALLAAAYLLMTLPNLGAHTLWDMDEGVNAEAAREMLEAERWITPHYNYQLRTAKPALLYWLQALSFVLFGVNEWAARFPSVLCGLGTVWVTYELGRRMFSASTGLLAGLILASCIEFCLISHAATPDPPLILFLTLAFYLYWAGSEGERRWWFVPVGACCGLAALTKGPVGLALPGLIILLHLAWTRRLDKLWDHRLVPGALAFILVAGPWYGLVALDTRGKWVEDFIANENLKRFHTPADGHGAGWLAPVYHVVGIVILFAPWSVFLWETVRHAVDRVRSRADQANEPDTSDRYRFLVAWVLAFLVVFSVAATKLPNYVLPAYPALAVLTARTLDRWRQGSLAVSRRMVLVWTVGGALFGILVSVGLLLASGHLPLPDEQFRPLTALGQYAWVGVIPGVAALAFGWLAYCGRLAEALTAYALGAVLFLAVVAAFPTVAMNEYKVPRYFAEEVGLRQTDRDIRIAACRWFRHSLVFYVRREVKDIDDPRELERFLALPRPAYVLIPARVWDLLADKFAVPVRVIARRYDFYARDDILVLANEYADPPDPSPPGAAGPTMFHRPP